MLPSYNWPFSAGSTSDSKSLLPKRCSFLLKKRRRGRFGSSAHLRPGRPACTFKATALWASACTGGLAVQSTKVRRSQVQSEEANLQSHAAEAQAGAVCRDSLLLACPVAHLPPAQEFIHRAGRLTREDRLQASKSYCTLHYHLEFRLGPISALSKPPTSFTLQANVHCHRRLPLRFIHRGLSAGRLKVEACAIH